MTSATRQDGIELAETTVAARPVATAATRSRTRRREPSIREGDVDRAAGGALLVTGMDPILPLEASDVAGP
jgi:hypothetical protein